MNIFAFYLALQYIKIIGDFANKPDAFDDPAILKVLEQEVSDDPINNQGFLTQIHLQQDKIADDLHFEFEKIQKQQLIKKYSQKGVYNSAYLKSGVQANNKQTVKKAVNQNTKTIQSQNTNQQNVKKQQISKNSNNNIQGQNQKNDQQVQSTQTQKQTQQNTQDQKVQQIPEESQQKPIQQSNQVDNGVNQQEQVNSKSQQPSEKEEVSNQNQQSDSQIQKQPQSQNTSTQTTAHLKNSNILKAKNLHKTNTEFPKKTQSQKQISISTQTKTNLQQPHQQTNKTENTIQQSKEENKDNIHQPNQQKQNQQQTTKVQSTQTQQPQKQEKYIQTSQPATEIQEEEKKDNKILNQDVKNNLYAIKTSTQSALKKATDVFVKVVALLFILSSLIVYILMVIFGHKLILQEIQSGIANGYTEFIEKQQEVKILQKEMKDLLMGLYWRSIRGQKDADLLLYNEQGVEAETEYAGQRFSFNLTVPLNSTFTLVKIEKENKKKTKKSNLQILPKEEQDILEFKQVKLFDVKNGPQFLYYEIQIDYLHDKTDFVLGFTSKKLLKEIQSDYIPGVTDNSYGFRVKTGEILNNGNIVYTFNMLEEILDVYDMDESKNFDFNGSFFGIGVSLTTKEFFFSYNGRILNSLSFQTAGEIRFQIFNKKRKDELESDFYLHKQDKINRVAKALKLEKNQREEIKKNPTFKSKLSSYVPVIYVNGISKFYVNIGGYPLQLKERQIRTGLLKKNIMNNQIKQLYIVYLIITNIIANQLKSSLLIMDFLVGNFLVILTVLFIELYFLLFLSSQIWVQQYSSLKIFLYLYILLLQNFVFQNLIAEVYLTVFFMKFTQKFSIQNTANNNIFIFLSN